LVLVKTLDSIMTLDLVILDSLSRRNIKDRRKSIINHLMMNLDIIISLLKIRDQD